jgi:riboflavin synthase
MFTGIIEDVGEIMDVKHSPKSSKLTVKTSRLAKDVKVGDSVATNGVCITVTSKTSSSFEADVMAQTLRVTNLGDLKKGDKVNLERALLNNGRFDGHIVSGHVDMTGEIVDMKREDIAVWITIRPRDRDKTRYIIDKGSVALDGISLTVASVGSDTFKVSIIPHTAGETTLLGKKPGDSVNIECDVIAKYVEKLLSFRESEGSASKSSITMDFLSKSGF